MVKQNLLDFYNRIEQALGQRRFTVALSLLESMSVACSASWEVRSEIAQIAESFGYLSHYAFSGVADSTRKEQLESLCGRVITAATQLLRMSMIDDSHKLYYSLLRYQKNNSVQETLAQMLGRYKTMLKDLSLRVLAGKSQEMTFLKEMRFLEKQIFEHVWISFPLTADDETALIDAVSDSSIPAEMLNLLTSAVMLGALEFYDERRYMVLGQYYLAHRDNSDIKALCALLIALWVNRDKSYGVRFQKVFDTIVEDTLWESDFRTVFMAMARTHDTKRITRTMNEEILPELTRLQPQINKLMTDAEKITDVNALEENPEWEDMVQNSGLDKKLQALNDMQMSGADVMMSTFSSLKSFPFFSELVNWFRDYNADLIDGNSSDDVGAFIASAPMLCDSDKFSLLLCVQSMSAEQRRMMFGQLQAQMEQNAELTMSLLNPKATSRAQQVTNYVQSLYRFFELYRRKGEFKNPFAEPINPALIESLGNNVRDKEALRLVAEFYFKHGYYCEALGLYEMLKELGEDDSLLYQKMGYCYQRSGNLSAALDMYLKAEMLAPGSEWILRRIAHCYRILSQPSKALEYYKRIEAKDADDVSLALSIGHCQMELGKYHDAMRSYFKVEYLAPESGKHLRPMAWCSLMLGDLPRAEKYYEKVLGNNPEPSDYLNIGHLYMMKNEVARAIDSYQQSPILTFASSMAADRELLVRHGVDPVLIDLVIDKVLSK